MKLRRGKYAPPVATDFYRILNADVRKVLLTKKNHRYADQNMVAKILFCLMFFAVCYSQYLNPAYSYTQWLGWCLLLGFASMLLGVNTAHDAIHGSLFRKNWMNTFAGFSFDLIGISSYSWRLKHNHVHHHFPNVTSVDFDIEAGPVLRFSPADRHYWFHRYQHLYAPLVYMLFSLHMLFLTDIQILVKEKRENIDGKKHPKWQWAIFILQKCLYLFYMIGLPLYLLPFSTIGVLAGFLLMHAVLSLLMALILLPSHLFEQTCFSEMDEKGIIEEDWAVHQVRTTLDFAAQNSLVHFLFGGFNTNVVHHLFPSVCHCHYKELTLLIKKRCAELSVPYHHTSLGEAVISHFRVLKKMGRTPK